MGTTLFSILITAYKEPRTVEKLLLSLAKLNANEYEIVLVAPDGQTLNVAKKLSKKYKHIKFLKDQGKGKPTALNLALKHTRGKILILTDGDVFVESNSILLLIKHFKDPKVGAVSGKVVYQIQKDSLFYEWAKLSEKYFDEIRKKQSGKTLNHPTGYLYAIRKDLMPVLPENVLSDDAYVGMYVTSKGYKIIYEPKAIVYVKFPSTIKDFINQKARTRAGFLQLKQWFGETTRTPTKELFGLKHLFQAYRWKIHKMLFVLLIYLIAWLKAYWIFKTKKSFSSVWVRIKSTK